VCGIGFIFDARGADVAVAAVGRMVAAIGHRGPDAVGWWNDGPVALGHARLSIVDIVGGGQPMHSSDGRYTLVFNGEIYNYRTLRSELEQVGEHFHTESDTEVLLRLYQREGAACVARLRGMFAFAVHDAHSGGLVLARDRLGIKPLFYHWDGGRLSGASEIKALFAAGVVEPQLDPATIRSYFRYQFTPPGTNPFVGIEELPPGHCLSIAPGRTPRLRRYWDLAFPRDGEYESLDEDYWLQRFGDALDDAAASHTIGEVPIGAYLSGGIDSATTARLLSRHAKQAVQTYTIRFSAEELDESPLAAEIAAHLGVANQTVAVDDARPGGYLHELLACVYHLEQPQRMAVDVPHFLLSGLVHARQGKVVYTGDGADEILGGYDCYRQDAIREWGNQQPDAAARERFYFEQFGSDFAETHLRLLLSLHEPARQRATCEDFGCYPAWHDFWHILDDLSEPLFTDTLAACADPLPALAAEMRPRIEGLHPLNQSLYLETHTRLPNWILLKSDRLSMAHSVEARVPFLDHPLVELAARVPPGLKLNGMDEKYILRRLMMPQLPQHPETFKKRAFYTPIREWFFTPERRAELEPYLGEAALREAGLFRPETVRRYLQVMDAAGEPRDMQAHYRVMKLEWTLLLVLTTQMLHRLFVAREAACFDASPGA